MQVHTINRQMYTSLLSAFESSASSSSSLLVSAELLLRTAWAVWNMWPASHVATAPGTGGGGPHGVSVAKDAPGHSHSCFRLWFSACTSLEGFLYASQCLWLKVKKNNTKTRVQSRRRITIPSYKVLTFSCNTTTRACPTRVYRTLQ